MRRTGDLFGGRRNLLFSGLMLALLFILLLDLFVVDRIFESFV